MWDDLFGLLLPGPGAASSFVLPALALIALGLCLLFWRGSWIGLIPLGVVAFGYTIRKFIEPER